MSTRLKVGAAAAALAVLLVALWLVIPQRHVATGFDQEVYDSIHALIAEDGVAPLEELIPGDWTSLTVFHVPATVDESSSRPDSGADIDYLATYKDGSFTYEHTLLFLMQDDHVTQIFNLPFIVFSEGRYPPDTVLDTSSNYVLMTDPYGTPLPGFAGFTVEIDYSMYHTIADLTATGGDLALRDIVSGNWTSVRVMNAPVTEEHIRTELGQDIKLSGRVRQTDGASVSEFYGDTTYNVFIFFRDDDIIRLVDFPDDIVTSDAPYSPDTALTARDGIITLTDPSAT